MSLLSRFCFSLLLLLPAAAFAHGYWIDATGSHKVGEPVTIRMYFGEYGTDDTLSGYFLDRMKETSVFAQVQGQQRQPVIMKQTENYWEGSFTPGIEGTWEIIGINEVREVQDWTKHKLGIVRPIQYLKTTYQAGVKKTALTRSTFLDLNLSNVKAGTYELQAFKKDSAFIDAKITVIHPAGWEKVVNSDAKGRADFSTPERANYLVVIEWIDNQPGQFNGKPYETVRHRLDYLLRE